MTKPCTYTCWYTCRSTFWTFRKYSLLYGRKHSRTQWIIFFFKCILYYGLWGGGLLIWHPSNSCLVQSLINAYSIIWIASHSEFQREFIAIFSTQFESITIRSFHTNIMNLNHVYTGITNSLRRFAILVSKINNYCRLLLCRVELHPIPNECGSFWIVLY